MEAVPEEYLRTVVFLCVDTRNGTGVHRVPKATGFFVRVPIEGMASDGVDYVVTARHCIEEARSEGNTHIYIRLNRERGTFFELTTDLDDWHTHDSADVAAIPTIRAALPTDVQPNTVGQISINISDFIGGGPDYRYVGDTQFGSVNIQPRVGHQVYFLGLFTQHYGQERNLPIARFGHISSMPHAVEWEIGNTRQSGIAYLIEFHSWGGHSGSPVFFLYPLMVVEGMNVKMMDSESERSIPTDVNLGWVTGLMGLVSGHYDIQKEAKNRPDLGEIQVGLNSGIAIVTPADAVTQLLLRDDLKEQRGKF